MKQNPNTKIQRPPRMLTAILYQVGTAAPAAVIMNNAWGVEPEFTYVSDGRYEMTMDGVTWVIANTAVTIGAGYGQSGAIVDTTDTILILSRNSGGSSANNEIQNQLFTMIEFYPNEQN